MRYLHVTSVLQSLHTHQGSGHALASLQLTVVAGIPGKHRCRGGPRREQGAEIVEFVIRAPTRATGGERICRVTAAVAEASDLRAV